MTDIAARRTGLHTRTGGPSDGEDHLLEHLLGWSLVVVLALLTAQLGLF
ncbi:SCO1431 family membrane protein [Streptomyces sp. DSM 41524]|uniref:SCO1431 family membrane protein n=2 Tax=Streptomyces violaceusniger group TaxID=2839105 RepID=A0A6G4AMF2_9ACTN|nr:MULTISPECIES: SCO1431 family membrane protein [Streptomyces]MBA6440004.1 SCO1431 family membrane protein [Streptomyces sp. GMR22]MBI0377991.1 SCO1431 family membrane protein [Streptomyces albiflaviniger]MEE4591728.1 SCO1431 family membrane protein [Streptomyces sp. DSM 41524]NEW73869.1 SCO1431 family membrane protein [Streptomyces rhizosphaericus]